LRVAYPWSINRLVITSPAIGFAVKRSAQGCAFRLQIDGAGPRQDCPDDPGQFVGQGDDSLVAVRSCFKSGEPTTEGMVRAVQVQEAGSSAVDDPPPDISVAALADPQQRLLSSCRVALKCGI
jgi:hypothetical protein